VLADEGDQGGEEVEHGPDRRGRGRR
jgi:hypothetical protein